VILSHVCKNLFSRTTFCDPPNRPVVSKQRRPAQRAEDQPPKTLSAGCDSVGINEVRQTLKCRIKAIRNWKLLHL
jgi:hypothetical protein